MPPFFVPYSLWASFSLCAIPLRSKHDFQCLARGKHFECLFSALQREIMRDYLRKHLLMRFYQGESFLEMAERIPKTPFQRDLSIVDRISIDGDYFVAREPREHQDSACVGY